MDAATMTKDEIAELQERALWKEWEQPRIGDKFTETVVSNQASLSVGPQAGIEIGPVNAEGGLALGGTVIEEYTLTTNLRTGLSSPELKEGYKGAMTTGIGGGGSVGSVVDQVANPNGSSPGVKGNGGIGIKAGLSSEVSVAYYTLKDPAGFLRPSREELESKHGRHHTTYDRSASPRPPLSADEIRLLSTPLPDRSGRVERPK
jgi:hypothetical protein